MIQEELQEMESALKEAYEHLVELNNKYNELLTEEHNENFKKEAKSKSVSLFFGDLDYEMKSMTEEEIKLSKVSGGFWLRQMVILFLEIFGSLSLLPTMLLILANAAYSCIKTKKIRNEYKNKVPEKKKEQEAKKNKDALYEEVFEARRHYHNLRKEYESKKFDSELKDKEENAVGMPMEERNPDIYHIYSEYINYVKGLLENEDNKRKVYGIKPENL
ncbi:MAG: hypothetical protein K2I70_04250 [Bacilli bacterium]|nr:hypothetical protein [Bacilli bacterium]